MAQGKTKIKAKLPSNSKQKSNKKNSAFPARKRAPAKPKNILQEKFKIQLAITKTVNSKNEEELRSRSVSCNSKTLSKAQLAVVDHHQKMTDKESMKTE